MTAVDDKTIGKYRVRLAESEDLIRRLGMGESLVSVKDQTLLYLFRIPDHERFKGEKYIKRVRIDGDDKVLFGTRGINLNLLKLYDARILDLTEFSDWNGVTPDEAAKVFDELAANLLLEGAL